MLWSAQFNQYICNCGRNIEFLFFLTWFHFLIYNILVLLLCQKTDKRNVIFYFRDCYHLTQITEELKKGELNLNSWRNIFLTKMSFIQAGYLCDIVERIHHQAKYDVSIYSFKSTCFHLLWRDIKGSNLALNQKMGSTTIISILTNQVQDILLKEYFFIFVRIIVPPPELI